MIKRAKKAKKVLAPGVKPKRDVAARLTPAIAKTSWAAIPRLLLENQGKLPSKNPKKPARLNTTELVVLINLLDFKWGPEAPFPSVKTIAKRMDCQVRTVRNALQQLEAHGLVRRETREMKTNLYHLEGLFKALESLIPKKAESAEPATPAA